jgi:hypothetical protein
MRYMTVASGDCISCYGRRGTHIYNKARESVAGDMCSYIYIMIEYDRDEPFCMISGLCQSSLQYILLR